MTVRMSVIEEQLVFLESEKLELKNQLDIMIAKSRKRKGEFTSLQAELEENLKTVETQLALALERNNHLQRNLVHHKEKLNTSLKWTESSKFLLNITSQRNYNKKV